MKQLDDTALNIYTDGSSYSSPRVGGLGFLFVTVDENGHEVLREECPPGWRSATNNQMELQACIEALKFAIGKRSPFELFRFNKIVIYTDSQYISDNFDKAKWEWPKARWMTREGPPVANTTQWKELIKLVKNAGLRVEVQWVKGHKKDPYNKRVDKLARQSAQSLSARALEPQRVRRKKSPRSVEIGSVRMKGQVTTVRIITDKYLRTPHKCYRYMFEVMDESSPYYQHVDYATSEVMLSAGHTYTVRFNEDQRNPRIEEMLTEIREDEAKTEPEILEE